MAGFYLDPPYHRLGYDVDGGRVLCYNSAGTPVTSADIADLNREVGTPAYAPIGMQNGGKFCLIFPSLVQVQAFRAYQSGGGIHYVWLGSSFEYSTNTTNGWDGTWTAFSTTMVSDVSRVAIRTLYPAVSFTAHAIRVNSIGSYDMDVPSAIKWHIYGQPVVSGNRLELWHPTLDAKLGPNYLDWGDVPRSSTETRTFRVRNSGSQTANNIIVTTQALTTSTPSVVASLEVSSDNSTWVTQKNIGNLAGGALSSVLYARRSTQADSELGIHWTRLIARAGSWT